MNALIQPRASSFVREPSVARYLCDLFRDHGLGREHFYAIFLDAERRYLGDRFLRGEGVAALQLRAREILAEGLLLEARGLIIAHNHPSGICRPSDGDLRATKKLSEIACALDIELMDHLIITRDCVYSIRAGGNL